MERLLKNVTETDIINFDFIKRNRVSLKGKNKIITKIFSSRLSYDILHMAYERIDKHINSDFTYIDIINLNPSDAIHKFNNNKILEYANKHIKIYHTLSKFENDNNMGRNISIFAISSKVFGARYNLEYTIKMQDILIDVILNNKNVTVDSLVESIKDFANKNNLTYSTPRLSAIKNLIDKVNKYPNIYKELDKFVRLYTTSPVCERYEFLYSLIGDDINNNHIKNSLPFFSLRSSIFNDKNHNK
nr:MAG TPA: hypothetical protein [Caudoviricetes sp.]